jgi:hypothetical protein
LNTFKATYSISVGDVSKDQRGFSRNTVDAISIGAYEYSVDSWSSIQLQSGNLSGYVKVSNPVFSPDGNTIYVPTSSPNGHLFAIDRESETIKWVSQIATATYGGGAVVDAEGVIPVRYGQ